MYESPINVIISKLCTQLESDCMKSVQSYGFDVDKEELAKALNYDRNQYEKGYADGYKKAIDDLRNKLKNHYTEYNIDCVLEDNDFYSYTTACNYLEDYIDEIAEQLKEGGNND